MDCDHILDITILHCVEMEQEKKLAFPGNGNTTVSYLDAHSDTHSYIYTHKAM